jgi:Bacteriophage HK97-gp10, putative tail-component
MADEPITIKVRGVRQLEAGAQRLFANINEANSNDAIRATTQQVAATVRARVPKLTGRLASTVQAGRRGWVGEVTMGAGLPYARWIEFGGGRGRPFRTRGRYVYPTAKRTERAFRKHCETACEGQIRSMRWPTPR